MILLEQLKEARLLVKNPAHWVQQALAVDRKGEDCGWASEAACKFCLVGAILRVSGGVTLRYHSMYDVLCYAGTLGPTALEDFNDAATTTHPEVLALFDGAIEWLEALE